MKCYDLKETLENLQFSGFFKEWVLSDDNFRLGYCGLFAFDIIGRMGLIDDIIV